MAIIDIIDSVDILYGGILRYQMDLMPSNVLKMWSIKRWFGKVCTDFCLIQSSLPLYNRNILQLDSSLIHLESRLNDTSMGR